MHRLLIFLTIGCLGSPFASAAPATVIPNPPDPEPAGPADGPAAILRELDLSSPAPTGAKKFGLTFRGGNYSTLHEPSWCKEVAEAKIKSWFDENHNQRRDPEEIRPLSSYVYYRLVSTSVSFSNAPGNRAWLEETRQHDSHLHLVSVGDGGLVGTDSGESTVLHAIRGPLLVSLTMRCYLAVPSEPRLNSVSSRLNYGTFTRPDDAARLFATSGGDKYGWAYVDYEEVVSSFRKAVENSSNVAVEIAQEMIRAWDTWANQRPVSTAPGDKGLYPPDMSPYWPRPNEMPEGLVLKEDSHLPEGKDPVTYLAYRSADKAHNYDINLTCYPLQAEQLYADAPLQLAHAAYQNDAMRSFQDSQEFHSVQRPLAWRGADEAVQTLSPYNHVVMFRCANVVVTVKGYGGGSASAPESYQCEPIARTILAKLLNDLKAPPSIPVPGFTLREKNSDATVMLDGLDQKTFVARCVDATGKPVAGLRVSLTVDDSKLFPRGTLSSPIATTRSNGEAVFYYTPPALSPGQGSLPAGLAVSASCTIGKPPRPLGDVLTLQVRPPPKILEEGLLLAVLKPGYEQPFRYPFATTTLNGKVQGRLVTEGATPKETVPLAHAVVWVEKPGQPVNFRPELNGADLLGRRDTATTGPDGSFSDLSFNLSGNVQITAGGRVRIPDPVKVPVDPQLVTRLGQAGDSTRELVSLGYDALMVARYIDGYRVQLAASNPVDTDLTKNTGVLVAAPALLALQLEYTVLLERKFTDSAGKFTGNLNEAIDKCFELAGLGDQLAEKGKELRTVLGEKVQEGRKEMQDKIEQTLERGKNARLLFLYKLLGRVWSAAESSFDFLDKKLAKAEKGSDESEITQLAKKIREHPYRKTAEAIFHPGKTADDKIKEYSKALESYTQESVHEMVDGMARGNHKEFVNQLLALGCGRITQGKAFWSNPENVMEPARERFAEYSQSHLKPVEEEYASTMLYLNVKQVVQPIAGAVEIYVNGKEKLSAMATAASDAIAKLDWDALKSSINLSADKVDAAFDIFDKALVGWQAQPYLQDCRECEWVMADLTDLISLPRK